ncbi:hypothetical protein D3C76_1099350 [compost metagenome]
MPAVGVVDDFEDVDLDERRAVTAVVHTLEVGALLAVQIVIHRADVNLWPGRNGQGKTAQTHQ